MAGLAMALAAGPARAADAGPSLIDALRALQNDDARVNTIGYRLATTNAPFCADVRPNSGLLLLDAGAYRLPDKIRGAMSLSGDFAVQAVARGSMAEKAGLKPGDELLALEDRSAEAMADHAAPGTAHRLNLLHERIEQIIAVSGEVRLTLRNGKAALGGSPACHAHFELTTAGKGAQAADARVLVSRAILSKARSDDEAAFVMAHELAHLVLNHQRRRAGAGRSRTTILETEREADRLAVWLMSNAGFDPAQAPGFLRHHGAKGLSALFQEPHHDRAEARARLVEGELLAVRSAGIETSGLKDWRARFNPLRAEPRKSPSADAP